MLEIAEAAGDAATEHDDPADGLGATVARAFVIEVGQERGIPASSGFPKPGALRDRAGQQRRDQLLRQPLTLGERGLAQHVSDLLGALVGDLDRDVIAMGRECAGQTDLLARRVAYPSGAENMTDAVEGIALAASVAEGHLLDSAADIVERSADGLVEVERIQHVGGVLELVVNRVLVA